MSYAFLFITLLLQVAFLVGLLFYPMFLLDWMLEGEVLGRLRHRPARVYMLSLLSLTLVTALWLFLFVMSSIGFGVLLLVWVVVVPVGVVLWIVQFIRRRRESRAKKAFRKRQALPKMHCWLQDVFVAVFVYGASMVLLAAPGPVGQVDAPVVVAWAVYALASQTFGLYVGLDVIRREEALKVPVSRACYLGALLVLFLFLLPFGWLSWRAWQRAMWLWEQETIPAYLVSEDPFTNPVV